MGKIYIVNEKAQDLMQEFVDKRSEYETEVGHLQDKAKEIIASAPPNEKTLLENDLSELLNNL